MYVHHYRASEKSQGCACVAISALAHDFLAKFVFGESCCEAASWLVSMGGAITKTGSPGGLLAMCYQMPSATVVSWVLERVGTVRVQ